MLTALQEGRNADSQDPTPREARVDSTAPARPGSGPGSSPRAAPLRSAAPVHGRSDDGTNGRFGLGGGMDGLASAPTTNTFLVMMSH